MGSRGPQPGFKRARAEAKAAADAALAAAGRAAFVPRADAPLLIGGPKLSVAQQANPRLLGGEQLRALGHRMGLARSAMATMSDERVREQLRYVTQNRIDEDQAA